MAPQGPLCILPCVTALCNISHALTLHMFFCQKIRKFVGIVAFFAVSTHRVRPDPAKISQQFYRKDHRKIFHLSNTSQLAERPSFSSNGTVEGACLGRSIGLLYRLIEDLTSSLVWAEASHRLQLYLFT